MVFSPSGMRERSAGRRFGNKLTPRERRRVLLRSSTRASRRSTAAIFYTATALLGLDRRGLTLTLSGRHLRRRSSRPVQPSKADPSSGSGSDRASRSVVTSHGCGRRTLLRQLDVPRRRPQLSKAWRVYRAERRKEGKLEFRCEFTGERRIAQPYQRTALSFRGVGEAREPGIQSHALDFFSGFRARPPSPFGLRRGAPE